MIQKHYGNEVEKNEEQIHFEELIHFVVITNSREGEHDEDILSLRRRYG